MVDYFLFVEGWPIIRNFTIKHLWLRLRWGFRETEIVFRRPTRLPSRSPNLEERQSALKDSVYRAISTKLLDENPGYTTAVEIWALDYKAISAAYELAASHVLDDTTWNLSVWQKIEGQWTVWEVWRINDKDAMQSIWAALRKKLVALDKMHVLTQWEAKIAASKQLDGTHQQFTSSANDEVLAIFRNEGLDLEVLWREAEAEARSSK